MINIIRGFFNKGANHISNISSTIQKEEVDVLGNSRNSLLQEQIVDRKNKKILQEKGKLDKDIRIPKPTITIGNTKWDIWECDKMEPNRLEILGDNSLKFTIKTGDYLQVNNKQIYTDEDKQKELSDLTDKKAVERTEIQGLEKLELGKKYISKFSFMLPKNFPLLSNRLVIGQWKQESNVPGASQNPFLAQKIKKNKLLFIMNTSGYITGNTGSETIAEIPIKDLLGKWIDVEYDFKLSDTNDGYLKIKLNGKYIKMKINNQEMEAYKGPLLSSSNPENKKYFKDSIYFKFGLYRDNYDYGINLLKERHQKESNPNLEKEIAKIERAKQNEKEGNPMTIYFKNYSVENKNPSTQEESNF